MSRSKVRIYMTAAEAQYIADKAKEKGWEYFAVDYESRAIDHQLSVINPTTQDEFLVPPQKEDEGIW